MIMKKLTILKKQAIAIKVIFAMIFLVFNNGILKITQSAHAEDLAVIESIKKLNDQLKIIQNELECSKTLLSIVSGSHESFKIPKKIVFNRDPLSLHPSTMWKDKSIITVPCDGNYLTLISFMRDSGGENNLGTGNYQDDTYIRVYVNGKKTSLIGYAGEAVITRVPGVGSGVLRFKKNDIVTFWAESDGAKDNKNPRYMTAINISVIWISP